MRRELRRAMQRALSEAPPMKGCYGRRADEEDTADDLDDDDGEVVIPYR